MNNKIVEVYSVYQINDREYVEFGDREGSFGAFRKEWFDKV